VFDYAVAAILDMALVTPRATAATTSFLAWSSAAAVDKACRQKKQEAAVSNAMIAALLEYVVTHSHEAGEALFRTTSGGYDYFDLPSKQADEVAGKVQDLVDAVEAGEMMPKGPAKTKVRLFHSVLSHPDYPDVLAAAKEILEGGLSVERARQFESWAGPFRAIWTQTDEPYNRNVVWVAFDLDRKDFDPFILNDIDDTRRRSPVIVHVTMDVPGRKIVAVNGLPVGLVRKALK
jgi:hypothetical protein